jgi:hypothetical protein
MDYLTLISSFFSSIGFSATTNLNTSGAASAFSLSSLVLTDIRYFSISGFASILAKISCSSSCFFATAKTAYFFSNSMFFLTSSVSICLTATSTFLTVALLVSNCFLASEPFGPCSINLVSASAYAFFS